MPVPLIPCRNTQTGAETEIPQTALRHLPDWEPIPDEDTAAPAPSSTGAATAPPASDRPAASAAGKSKAAKATQKED